MKISLKEVIDTNRPWLSNFVPQYSPRDTIDTVVNKVGPHIQVRPDNTPTRAVTIRFITNMVVAVSDGEPDAELIRKVLGSMASTAVGLTGQGGQAIVMNGIPILSDITNAANQLYQNKQKTPTLQFLVPLTIENENCEYNLTCRMLGSTITTDSDKADEKANIRTDLRWLRNVSQEDEEKNEGTESARSYRLTTALEKQKAPKGKVDVAATAQINVRTDGAVWHDTISAVRIDVVEIIIIEVCSEKEKSGIPGTDSKTGQKKTETNSGKVEEGGGEKDESDKSKNPESVTRIEGINTKMAGKLKQGGITTLEHLAEMDVKTSEIRGISQGRLSRWQDMARVLVAYPVLDGNDAQVLVEGLRVNDPVRIPEAIQDMSVRVLKDAVADIQVPKNYTFSRLLNLE